MNVKSLTGDKIIGNSEYVTVNSWMVLFLEAHVYEIKKNIISKIIRVP